MTEATIKTPKGKTSWHRWLLRLGAVVLFLVVLLFAGVVMANLTLNAETSEIQSDTQLSAQYRDGKFHNDKPAMQGAGLGEMLKIAKDYFTGDYPRREPVDPIPVQPLFKEALASLSPDQTMIYRLGHSTLLLHINGEFWLTDPVFSDRASPFQFMGPKRFHPVPINPSDLPNIKGVILSHNHYDHLDKGTIKQLLPKVEQYFVPLGVGGDLKKCGVAEDQITEMDWWQTTQVAGVELVCTPSQHFSGRGLGDRDSTLWCSWVIQSEQHKVFFSGDSGYFDGFKKIGDQYGPFDLTFVETGAYNENWLGVHMMPEQSVQAHLDLKGKVMVPIHNGTFNLSFHTWDDPFEQVTRIANEQGAQVLTPEMGQPMDLAALPTSKPWWRGLK